MRAYRGHRFVYIIAALAAIGGLLFGYDTGIIAGALIFIQKSFVISTATKELIVSSVVLGALFGAISSGPLANRFGRRRMLIVAAIAFILGTLVSACALNPGMIVLGRLIIGLAIGVTSYTAPLFISEMAPPEQRGALVLLNGIAITGGEVLAFLVDYYLVPSASWRTMFATGLIPAVLLLLGMLVVPSTPRWLALIGKLKESLATLSDIRQQADVKHEYDAIINSLDHPRSSWKDVFARRMRPVLIIGLALGILQQFSGINTVMYYGPYIFKAAGVHGASTQVLATLVMGIANTVFTIVTVLVVDRIGRRPLLIGGTLVASLSLLWIGFLFHGHVNHHGSPWMMIVLMLCYISGYSISVGSLFWLIISEIYPLNVRSLAMSFVTAMQWLANFVVAATFLSILNGLGPATTFWLYSGMCAIALVFSYYWVPETRGVSLEVIEQQLTSGRWHRHLDGQQQ